MYENGYERYPLRYSLYRLRARSCCDRTWGIGTYLVYIPWPPSVIVLSAEPLPAEPPEVGRSGLSLARPPPGTRIRLLAKANSRPVQRMQSSLILHSRLAGSEGCRGWFDSTPVNSIKQSHQGTA